MPDYDLGTARGKIELDASSLGRASQSFTHLGGVMVGVGALAVGAFAYAVKSAADFEKVMSAVGAVSNATAAEMAAMKEVALDLGATTVYGADQIGRAMEQLAKAGLTIPEILGGATEATVTLAAAAGDELAGGVDQAATVIANAMKTFGAGADELDHFADVLVGAAASSTLSVDDIATSMTYAGPVAASLGLSIDDLSTALAILGDRGIRGSTAGTSLRGVFLSLATQTPKATQVMKDLGLITEDGTNKFFDLNGAMKPLPEVMQLLGDATKNLSEEEKIAAFNAIFQRRAMNSAMILAEQGAAGFDKYAAAIARIDASDVAAKKLDNLSGDVTILKNAFETLMIRVGLPFQEMLRGWVQSITDLVNKLNEVSPELLAQVAMYVAIGGAIAIAVGSALLAIGVFIKMYKNFILLKEAIALVWGAMKLLTLSFLTNPIFLFIAAIAAIGFALYKAYQDSKEFRKQVDGALAALKPAFDAAVRFVQNFVEQFGNLIDVLREGDDVASGVAEVIDNMFGNTGKLIGPIQDIVTWMLTFDDVARSAWSYFANEILPGLVRFGQAVAQAVGQAVRWFLDEGVPAIQRFADAVMNQLGLAMGWIERNVVPIFTAMADFVTAAIDRIVRVIGFFAPLIEYHFNKAVDILKFFWAIAKSIFEGVVLIFRNFGDNVLRIFFNTWDSLKSIVEAALRIVRGIITLVTGIISGDWEKAWDGVQKIFSGAWALISSIVHAAIRFVWEAISLGVDLIIGLWDAGWNLVVDIVRAGWDLIVSTVSGYLSMVWNMISNTMNVIWQTIQNVWDAILGFFKHVWAQIVAAVSSAISAVVSLVSGIWGKISSAIGNLAQSVYNFFLLAFMKMKEAVQTQIDAMLGLVGRIPGNILSALGNIGRLLYDAGLAIMRGLKDGIVAGFNAVKDFVGGIAGTIAGLKGPLSYDRVLLEPAGTAIMGGLMKAMVAQMPALMKLASSIAPSIEATFSSGVGTALTAPQASGSSSSTINVTLEFPNVTSAEEAEGVKEVLSDGGVMTKVMRAARSGSGRL